MKTKGNMKRIAGLIIIPIILLSGCSSSDTESVAEEVTAETTTTAAEETLETEKETDYSELKKYIGEWEDLYSLRCTMDISALSEDQVSIFISWSGGADENEEWNMTGVFQPESGIVEYSDCVRTKVIYMDNGDVSSQEVYTNGTGKIYIEDNGYLYWEDEVEGQGEQCYFSKMGAAETTTETGNFNFSEDVDWDDGTGLEGFLHKGVDPWGVPWKDYRYTDYETLYRSNGRDESKESYRIVMSGYVSQALKDTIIIMVNYNGDDDYMQALINSSDVPDPQRVIIRLQDDYTIPYGTMYMEGDIITVYGVTIGNEEISTVGGMAMKPGILACDIVLEDGTLPVTQLNVMHAYRE
ncbi:hypothetical protein B5E84_17305 [Lachnoclostridium sp. An14]|uniref:hypothetical protein n=1 Tax=Lachnoclostridium sp. An14 TaxID=1965562 RepID=UPI000B39DC04|nr:hypothetical protein [Lachnoclostridium sp. An14]OUQ13521.1 hypothetical protein B5E84_17305 [Lachnoclostridium sp. An14]